MRRLFFAVLCALALCGCGSGKRTLHLFCWADYISPELIQEFEREYDCRVVYDTFDSNEALLAKLQAGATGYDLIFPSHYVIGILANSGIIRKLNPSRLSAIGRLDRNIVSMLPDSECEYSVPYMVSYTGIGYNAEAVRDFEPTWAMFDRTDLQRRATLLDDKREVIGAALLAIGLDPNSVDPGDLGKAKEKIAGWLKNVSKLENEQYKNGLASREFNLAMGYSGDVVQVVDEHPHVKFAIPREGCMMNCDAMCIPAGARDEDLAYAFIDFIHEPGRAAANVEYTEYLCPNSECYSLLPESVRSNPAIFLPKDALEKSRFTADQRENEAVLNKLWQDVKAGK